MHRAVAHLGDHGHLVRDEQQCRPITHHLADAFEATHLEVAVAHGECLVHREDVGPGVGDGGEGEPGPHPHRVVLDGDLHHLGESCELGDATSGLRAVTPRTARDHTEAEHVLAAGEIGVEPGAQLDEGTYRTGDLDGSGGRAADAGDELEQSGLAGPVWADQPDGLAPADLEVESVERAQRLARMHLVERRGIAPVARP